MTAHVDCGNKDCGGRNVRMDRVYIRTYTGDSSKKNGARTYKPIGYLCPTCGQFVSDKDMPAALEEHRVYSWRWSPP